MQIESNKVWASIRGELATKTKFVKDKDGAPLEVIEKKVVFSALDKYLMEVGKQEEEK